MKNEIYDIMLSRYDLTTDQNKKMQYLKLISKLFLPVYITEDFLILWRFMGILV